MRMLRMAGVVTLMLSATLALSIAPAAAQTKPNIMMIMGDDVGWFNIGAYHLRA